MFAHTRQRGSGPPTIVIVIPILFSSNGLPTDEAPFHNFYSSDHYSSSISVPFSSILFDTKGGW